VLRHPTFYSGLCVHAVHCSTTRRNGAREISFVTPKIRLLSLFRWTNCQASFWPWSRANAHTGKPDTGQDGENLIRRSYHSVKHDLTFYYQYVSPSDHYKTGWVFNLEEWALTNTNLEAQMLQHSFNDLLLLLKVAKVSKASACWC
jgi:hypothetical protein